MKLKGNGLYEILYELEDVDSEMEDDDLVEEVCKNTGTQELLDFAWGITGYLKRWKFTVNNGSYQTCDVAIKALKTLKQKIYLQQKIKAGKQAVKP